MAKVGRPKNIENMYDAPKSNVQFSEGQKSKGILDDYAKRKTLDTNEGTIQHIPTADKHLVNKEYVDSITPNEENRTGAECTLNDGDLNRVLTLGNTTLTSNPVIVFQEGAMVSPSDLNVSHLSASTTITFDLQVFDTDKIRIIYQGQT